MDQELQSIRKRFNPKRRFAVEPLPSLLEAWGARVIYRGNPEHKRDPGNFGLTPPSDPRPDKSLCDWIHVFDKVEAQRLLQSGIERGLISEARRGEFPKLVWAVTDAGVPLEAQLENEERGEYHGYPMSADDPFRWEVLRRWESP